MGGIARPSRSCDADRGLRCASRLQIQGARASGMFARGGVLTGQNRVSAWLGFSEVKPLTGRWLGGDMCSTTKQDAAATISGCLCQLATRRCCGDAGVGLFAGIACQQGDSSSLSPIFARHPGRVTIRNASSADTLGRRRHVPRETPQGQSDGITLGDPAARRYTAP